jgi:hypothetical protein
MDIRMNSQPTTEQTPHTTKVTKQSQNPGRFTRPYRRFVNARSAFKAFLKTVCPSRRETVLLPSYIGWSSKEGSGVFDPISELKLPFAFYKMDENLHIDLDHLEKAFKKKSIRVLVLIHYFGYVDPGYAQAVRLARDNGALVLEDEAHAMLTDLIGGRSGRLGDASIFSLHKMLPVPNGGMLLASPGKSHLLPETDSENFGVPSPWEFDLRQIADRRLRNANLLAELLQPLSAYITPLRSRPEAGVVPQTYPVIVNGRSRDDVYHAMNNSGYGVVSLYHTMIPEISPKEFPASHELAGKVLNLPVHQDVEPRDLVALVEQLARCLGIVSEAVA